MSTLQAAWKGALIPGIVTLTDAATIAVDASKGNAFRVTLGGNRTLGAPTLPPGKAQGDGMRIIFEVTQDGTGSRTLAYTSTAGGYIFSTGLASPTLSTAAGSVDVLEFVYSTVAGKWRFVNKVLGFAS
jgi:hypothetical protein